MANALKEIEHAQRLCDRGDITIGEYFDLVEKWEEAEPKHGRWVKTGQSFVYSEKFRNYTCSECGSDVEKIPYNYCPNCGADMRGGEDG